MKIQINSMRFVYVGIVVGLVLLSLAVLFFLPAGTTGFATNIEPTQRTLLGSFLGTAGVASFGAAALKKKKRALRDKEFSEAYFNHFKEFVDDILYDTNLKVGQKIGATDTDDIVDRIAKKYGIRDDVSERVAEYLSRKVREHPSYELAEKAIGFALYEFARELYSRPEERRRKAVSKKWQI